MSKHGLKLRATLKVRNDVIIAAREQRGWSQTKLGEAAGVSLRAVAALEALDYSHNDVENEALKVAVALEINPDDILPPGFAGRKLQSRFSSVRTVDVNKLLDSPEMLQIAAPEKPDPITTKELHDEVRSVLKTLTKREEFVLCKRDGIDGDCHTFLEISDMLRLSLERVRQVYYRALRKLQHPRRASRLVKYADFLEFDKLEQLKGEVFSDGYNEQRMRRVGAQVIGGQVDSSEDFQARDKTARDDQDD
jgi:transcriptional regulator with XRE-family HTH domain